MDLFSNLYKDYIIIGGFPETEYYTGICRHIATGKEFYINLTGKSYRSPESLAVFPENIEIFRESILPAVPPRVLLKIWVHEIGHIPRNWEEPALFAHIKETVLRYQENSLTENEIESYESIPGWVWNYDHLTRRGAKLLEKIQEKKIIKAADFNKVRNKGPFWESLLRDQT